MDSITQAALGAAIGEAMLAKKIGSKGALAGAAVATIPDFDVALHLFYSKFDMLSIHRGFSHSIAFSVLGALAVAFLLGRTSWLRQFKFTTLLLFAWLCLFTHMLLDAFTAYGTQLLLPFSNQRVGFDSINVVDPVYTIPLLLGLFLSLRSNPANPKRARYNAWGILASSAYLLFTLANKQGVNAKIRERLHKEQIEYSSLLTMPVGTANLNWYGVAKGNDSIYLMQHSAISGKEGPVHAFPVNEQYLNDIDPQMADKMRWFAKGFYTVDKVGGKTRVYNLQVDMRGVANENGRQAPTVGYFEIYNENGKPIFTSGSIKRD